MSVQEFAFFLRAEARDKSAVIFIGAALAGLLQAAILFAVFSGVREYGETGRSSVYSYACFLLGMAVYFVVYRHITNAAVGVALEFITRSQKNIASGLRDARYYEFTRLDQPAIYAALSGNTGLITESARFLPNCVSACVLLAASLVYAVTVSVAGFVGLLALFVGVAMVFNLLESGSRQIAERAGAAQQRFLSGVHQLFGGFVELKMNPKRSDALFKKRILPNCAAAAEEMRRYEDVHMRGNSLYSVLNYIPTGLIVFVAPFYADITTQTMLTFVGISMFCVPALVNLAMIAPLTGKALDVIGGIRDLETRLESIREGRGESAGSAPEALDFCDEITAAGLRFAYPSGGHEQTGDAEQSFNLDICGFSLKKGEILLIRGGNGSGKSTFFRVIAGLLPSSQGTISVDGTPLSDMDINAYRSLFSCVFTDFYLFDSVLGLDVGPEDIAGALAMVRLDKKVGVTEDGVFSSTDLSTGQRKRLALACALLEKRPVLLLDEVAADFDPKFREYFYKELLPALQKAGKTVLAISHDDRYFSVADRVITMEYGSMTSCITGGEAAEEAIRLAGRGI